MKNLRIALFAISMMAIILPLELWSQCTFCPSSVTNGSSSSALGFGNSALGASSTVIGFRKNPGLSGGLKLVKLKTYFFERLCHKVGIVNTTITFNEIIIKQTKS